MIKATVRFIGKQRDQYGMPSPYHSYLVFSSPWQLEGSGIASVLTLSRDTPMPSPSDVITEKGGEEEAFQMMLQSLHDIPGNKELEMSVHRQKNVVLPGH